MEVASSERTRPGEDFMARSNVAKVLVDTLVGAG